MSTRHNDLLQHTHKLKLRCRKKNSRTKSSENHTNKNVYFTRILKQSQQHAIVIEIRRSKPNNSNNNQLNWRQHVTYVKLQYNKTSRCRMCCTHCRCDIITKHTQHLTYRWPQHRDNAAVATVAVAGVVEPQTVVNNNGLDHQNLQSSIVRERHVTKKVTRAAWITVTWPTSPYRDHCLYM